MITIDDLLLAHTFIARIDEAMSHFDVRSEYSKRMGQALAQTYDRNLLSYAVKAARDPSGLGAGAVGQGDAYSADLGDTPTVQNIIDGIYDAAEAFDVANIPMQDRHVVVPPSVYWGIITNDKLLDKDYSSNTGSYVDGKVPVVAGFKVHKSNNLAVNHVSATVDYGTKYQIDASHTKFLCLTKEAMATVKLMELASEMEYDIRRQGTLMVTKMAVGHGILRPEGIYEGRATP